MKRSPAGQQQGFGRGSVLCRLFLVLALILSPFAAIATHGPAAYAEAAETTEADLAHGHSHDFDGKGAGTHNVADHDHQTLALFLVPDDQTPTVVPSLLQIETTAASGRERDGPRRIVA